MQEDPKVTECLEALERKASSFLRLADVVSDLATDVQQEIDHLRSLVQGQQELALPEDDEQ